MGQRIVRRYSACFKQQVVGELENGRFDSIEAARRHYEIGGAMTIQRWLKRLGKNHLKPKVVRVETPDEADRIDQLQQRVRQLEQALGRTQAQNVLNEQYLHLACEQLGQDVETFVKKCDGKRFTPGSSDRT
jgi:transposase-like protein